MATLSEGPQRTDNRATAIGTPVPDLEIFVKLDASGTLLDFKLRAIPLGRTDKIYDSVPLRPGPDSYLRRLLGSDGFSNPAYRHQKNADLDVAGQAEKDMRCTARFLAKEILPSVLFRALSRFPQNVTTLQIQSEEPWIPWELLGISSVDLHGGRGKPRFLCERFDLTHWLPGRDLPARLAGARCMDIQSIAIIAPEDTTLAQVQNEVNLLSALGKERGLKIDRIPATTNRIIESLSSGRYDLLHFAGHGKSPLFSNPDSSAIVGQNGDAFTPIRLVGEIDQLGERAPIVFFNACHSASRGFSLTGLGGWAARFVDLGAAAFLGPCWTVPDEVALRFCVEFYDELFRGETIGASVGAARRCIRRDGDPNWLAYSAYAHPLLRCRTPKRDSTRRAHNGQRSHRQPSDTPSGSDESFRRQELTARGGMAPVSEATRAVLNGIASKPSVASAPTPARPAKPKGPAKTFDPASNLPHHTTHERDKERRTRSDSTQGAPVPTDSQSQSNEKSTQVALVVSDTPSARVHGQSGISFVFVPDGRFTLGAASGPALCEPVHTVALTGYWIAMYPVTNAQYRLFCETTSDLPESAFWHDPRFNAPDQPVVGITWEEAQTFCSWAGLLLPSEAQWEAAARGTDGRRYPWGDDRPSQKRAVFAPHAAGPAPVDRAASNGPFGTVGQAGNVSEWCRDTWDARAYRGRHLSTDPVVLKEDPMRVVRGGSWRSPARELLAACRGRLSALARVNSQGFRCVWNGEDGEGPVRFER